MKNPTCLTIVEQYLKSNGYDGLVNIDASCGCKLGSLAPCCSDISNCQAGYRGKCTCGEGCDFDIYLNEEDAWNGDYDK